MLIGTRRHVLQYPLIGGEGDSGASGSNDEGTGELPPEPNAGEASGGDNTTDESAGQVSFPDGLDDDVKNDPSLKVFVNEKNEINYANLMKSYVHAQKQMGKEKVIIPTDASSSEDWESFYAKMGRPELADYKVDPKLADGQELDQEMLTGFVAEAHKAGIMPNQAQAVLDWFNTRANDTQESMNTKTQEQFDTQLGDLKKSWGDGYENEKKLADSALKELVQGDLLTEFNEAGLGDNITMLKVFNKIGKALMTEDSFDKESTGSFGITPEEAQGKINSHMSDPQGAYMNPDHADHKNAVQQVAKLNAIVYK